MLSQKSSEIILRKTLLIVTALYSVGLLGLSYRSGRFLLPERPLLYAGGLAIVFAWLLSRRNNRLAWALLLATLTFACAIGPATTTGTFNLGLLMLPTLMTLAAFVFGSVHALTVFWFSSAILALTVYLEVSGLTSSELATSPARGVIIFVVWLGFVLVLTTVLRHVKSQNRALHLAEERLRIAVDTLQDGFVLYDENDRLVMCNRRYRELYPDPEGLASPGVRFEDMLRARVDSGFYADAHGIEEDWISERLAQRRLPRNIALHRTSGDRWLRIADQRTESGGLVGITTDVTEIRKAQETLQDAQKMEAIGQLTGGLAHDFNNLLGIVVGNLDEMKDRLSGNDPMLFRHHALALEAALRGAEVTRSLLAVARRQPMEVRVYDLDRLVDEMLPLLRTSAGSSVTLIHEPSPVPILCHLDSQGLGNAILNLVINARDAMAASSERRITISVSRETAGPMTPHELSPGDYAVLDVEDTGSGMSEAVRARALEPFFTTKDRTRGTGLGLSMVYGYAKQLGGTARLSSIEGQGTTVSIFLPLTAAAPEHAPARAGDDASDRPRVAARSASSEPVLRPRALVVDDEAALCEISRIWLESLGYTVTTAVSPTEALEAMDARAYDLLLTDVVMPDTMDGIALAIEARKRQPSLRVLLASGYSDSLAGVTDIPGDILPKPFRKADLVRVLG